MQRIRNKYGRFEMQKTLRRARAGFYSADASEMLLVKPASCSNSQKTLRRARAGFSFIELMVVVVIMAIVATAVLPRFMGATDQARVSKAQQDIMNLSTALKLYRLDNGFYPATEQGLNALIVAPTSDPIPASWKPGGYIEGDKIPVDPWGTPYVYRVPGTGNKDFDLISLGADKREGGTDYNADITN